jgi:hypothetical protein
MVQFVCEQQNWDKEVVFWAVGMSGMALQMLHSFKAR